LKIPKKYRGRTKQLRGPQAAREPRVWGLVYTMCKTAWLKKKHCCQQSAFFATDTSSNWSAQLRRPFAQWNLISRTCAIPKHRKNTKTRRSYL